MTCGFAPSIASRWCTCPRDARHRLVGVGSCRVPTRARRQRGTLPQPRGTTMLHGGADDLCTIGAESNGVSNQKSGLWELTRARRRPYGRRPAAAGVCAGVPGRVLGSNQGRLEHDATESLREAPQSAPHRPATGIVSRRKRSVVSHPMYVRDVLEFPKVGSFILLRPLTFKAPHESHPTRSSSLGDGSKLRDNHRVRCRLRRHSSSSIGTRNASSVVLAVMAGCAHGQR